MDILIPPGYSEVIGSRTLLAQMRKNDDDNCYIAATNLEYWESKAEIIKLSYASIFPIHYVMIKGVIHRSLPIEVQERNENAAALLRMLGCPI